MKPAFLLSKSLELVRIEQDPVRVFVSVQFDRRFEFQKRSQLFIRTHVFAQPKVEPRFLR